jgi:hypothetical protein
MRFVLLLALVAGCTPVITPVMPQWEEDVHGSTVQIVKEFRATVTNLGTAPTLKVIVRFSRHRWQPGLGNAFEGEATRSSLSPSEFSFAIRHQDTYVNTQAVFFEWFVVDRAPDGTETILAETDVQQFRIGCAGTGTDDSLKSDQATVVGSFDNASSFPPSGYILPHRHVSFKGNGRAAARVQVIEPGHTPTLGQPDLLFYDGAGPPFRLLGWAYTFPFDADKRPHFFCFPYEAWFVHEAGWHTSDGLFECQPNALSHPTTGGLSLTPPFWHGRVWDLHLWRRDGQVPVVAAADDTIAQDGVSFPACAFHPTDVTPFP